MRRLIVALLALHCALLPIAAAAAEQSTHPIATTPAAKRIQADVRFLADDLLEGREVGQRGYSIAARYVAARMQGLGLEPGTAAGFEQRVPLLSQSIRRDSATFVQFGEKRLAHTDGVLVSTSSEGTTTGNAVFAGYGLYEPKLGIDDYAGLDVRGKIVVVLSGFPTGIPPDVAAHLNREKTRFAAEHGAIGMLFVDTPTREKVRPFKDRVVHAYDRSMTWVGPDGRPFANAPEIKGLAIVTLATAPHVFAGSERDWASVLGEIANLSARPHGFPLAQQITIAASTDSSPTEAPNVIGLIPGSDPKLRDEIVVLSAHLDHVGLANEGEDRVYNGALDNAMGVSILLEVARLLKEGPPPRRTIAIVALAAEEKGLLGSDYLAHFPPFGDRRIVADVNIDMPVLLGNFTGVLAFGMEHSSLGGSVTRAAQAAGLAIVPDKTPEQSYFTRSDQYSFVHAGIPAVKLNPKFDADGDEREANFRKTDYHEVSDSADLPIWWDEAGRFAQLNLAVLRDVANASATPAWNDDSYFKPQATPAR